MRSAVLCSVLCVELMVRGINVSGHSEMIGQQTCGAMMMVYAEYYTHEDRGLSLVVRLHCVRC